MFVYLCAAIPNHTYKLASCWYKPSWYALYLMPPCIWAHWVILVSSQHYYFVQCVCSAYRCWYPSAIFMQIGAGCTMCVAQAAGTGPDRVPINAVLIAVTTTRCARRNPAAGTASCGTVYPWHSSPGCARVHAALFV